MKRPNQGAAASRGKEEERAYRTPVLGSLGRDSSSAGGTGAGAPVRGLNPRDRGSDYESEEEEDSGEDTAGAVGLGANRGRGGGANAGVQAGPTPRLLNEFKGALANSFVGQGSTLTGRWKEVVENAITDSLGLGCGTCGWFIDTGDLGADPGHAHGACYGFLDTLPSGYVES